MALDLDFGGSDLSAHADAIEQLLDFEVGGKKVVVRVGLGFKLAGQAVAEPLAWAYRVYVAYQKDAEDPKAASEAAFAAIPATVNGVPTDVFFEILPFEAACQSELAPGMKLTPCKQGSEIEEGYGTIGLVIQKGSDRFLLTDGHVLLKALGGGDPEVVDVFVPDRKSSLTTRAVVATSLLPMLHNTLSRTQPDKNCFFTLDVGLAQVKPGMDFSATPVEAGGPVNAMLRDLISESLPAPPSAPIHVWKYGARTELTHGTVVELLNVIPNRNTFWTAQIQPTQGYTEPRRFYVSKAGVSADSIDEIILRFRNRMTTVVREGDTNNSIVLSVAGPSFAWQGDSGSAVYDAGGSVVGLVRGGEGHLVFDATVDSEAGILTKHLIMSEPTSVSYIAPAFAALGLTASDIATASGTAAGAAIAVPGAPAVVRRRRLVDGDVAALLARSPAGRTLRALSEHHGAELVRLVHHRRRVTVAWHRGKASAFANALLGVLDGSRASVPATIDGVTAGPALRALFAAMQHEAGSTLRDDLAQHAEWIARIADGATTIAELLDRLERG